MKPTRVETAADVLVRAFELADDIDKVIVIYERKKTDGTQTSSHLGCIESEDMTLAEANFLVDSYKFWLWSAIDTQK